MAAMVSLRPPEETTANDAVGMRSDVWPVPPLTRQEHQGRADLPRPELRAREPSRPEPSPAAFAIHDAKNMLGVLSANVEVLRKALQDRPLPDGAGDALIDIEEASRRLTDLLREALSGLQGHEPRRQAPTAMRIAPIVKAAVDRMRPAARARGVRIVESGSPDTRGTIDPDLLERVIVNLLENAVRFSQAGDTVEVEYENRRGRMTVAIGDRGPGVPENAREQIFESYLRRGADGDSSHFGLGLAFCRETARALGGDAWVFNRRQGGACFVFEITE